MPSCQGLVVRASGVPAGYSQPSLDVWPCHPDRNAAPGSERHEGQLTTNPRPQHRHAGVHASRDGVFARPDESGGRERIGLCRQRRAERSAGTDDQRPQCAELDPRPIGQAPQGPRNELTLQSPRTHRNDASMTLTDAARTRAAWKRVGQSIAGENQGTCSASRTPPRDRSERRSETSTEGSGSILDSDRATRTPAMQTR
jgi:hypothetical protein